MTSAPKLVDRKALKLHRLRAAKNPVGFLHDIAADELQERLSEINKSFTKPAIVGPFPEPFQHEIGQARAVADDDRLSLAAEAHDLVIHAFGLHWADDPVGQMVQSRLALEPDGLFFGVLFGGVTLQELRASLAEAETRISGGLSPRVAPMADMRDLGALLQRAGFALPVADSHVLRVRYQDLASLVRDLRGMGETNALSARLQTLTAKRLFDEAEAIYQANYSDEGYLVATFELVFLTGWAPDEAQQKPLRPGSANTRLATALGVSETPLKRH